MKKISVIVLALLMSVMVFSGCSSQDKAASGSDSASEASVQEVSGQSADSVSGEAASAAESVAESGSSESAAAGNSTILVAYFTRIGNTDGGFPEGVDAVTSASIQTTDGGYKGNAQMIAEVLSDETGGDLFAIESEEIYPADYDATVNKAKQDQNDGIRPALTTHVENMDSYDTVIIAFPNWWGDLPMPVYSFFDEYDLAGKNIKVYVTHEGSGFSDTVDTIKELEPQADVTEGLAVRGGEAADSEAEIRESI